MTPEEKARQRIPAMLKASGWGVPTRDRINLSATRGVAVCELCFATGEPDYTLFVDGRALGTTEAKPEGETLTGVEEQSTKHVSGVPFGLPAWKTALPFCYENTGTETFFTNRRDPDPRSRRVCSFHRPETLLAWVHQEKQLTPLAEQAQIVAEVEGRLSVVEELEAVVSANSDESRDSVLQRATRLRLSILQKAFTGKLV